MLKNYRLILLGIAVCTAAAMFTPLWAGAVPLNDVSSLAQNSGVATYSSVIQVLQVVLQVLLTVAFIVAVIFVVISGYRMVTSQGNDEALESAKKSLLWAIIGVVVIATSYVLLALISNLVKTGSP